MIIKTDHFPLKYSDKDYQTIDYKVAGLAHTIGHELFIHAMRKGILAMEKWQEKDFEGFKKEIMRDTGDRGEYDHRGYLLGKKDKGLNMMYAYGESLKKLVGSSVYNKIKKNHDETLRKLTSL